MAKKNEWPRLVMCDDLGWGLYREKEDAPIQMVRAGEPPLFLGELKPDELQAFNEMVDMDFPYASLLTEAEKQRAQKG